MEKEKGLLGVINCCFGGCPERTTSFYDLLIFGLFSIVIISLLLIYYNNISESTVEKRKLVDYSNSLFISVNIITLGLFVSLFVAFDSVIEYSSVLIIVLLGLSIFYLNYFHGAIQFKRVLKKIRLDKATPIYQSNKDILLQEKITDGVYLAESKKVSVWTKLVVYIFIIIAITTPLYKLFGVQHFI